MSSSLEFPTGEGKKPHLRRTSSWTESMLLEGPRLSSPVFYMRNSVQVTAKMDTGQTETEDDSAVTDQVIDTTGSLINMSYPRRGRSRDRRLVSLPALGLTTSDDPSALTDRQQMPLPEEGATSDYATASTLPSEIGENHYCTMYPVPFPPRNWVLSGIQNEAYINMHQNDGHATNGITAAFVLDEIAQNHLICNKCNQRYTQPKALDCLHSFCASCLESPPRNCGDAQCTAITCPVCRQVTELPQNGLAGLRDNTQLVALLEDVTKLETSLKGRQLATALDEVKTSRQSAKEKQKSWLAVQEGLIAPDTGSQQPSKPSPQGEADGVTTCTNHPRKDLTLFCKSCQKMICKDCTESDHHASEHGYVDAARAVDMCRNNLDRMAQMVRKDKEEFMQAVRSAGNVYRRLTVMVHDTRNKISRMEEQEIGRVRAQAATLQKEAAEIGQKRASEIKAVHEKLCAHAQTASQTLDNIQHTLTKASSLEILKMKQALFDEIKDVINKEVIVTPHELSFLDFQGNQLYPPRRIDLGKILLKEKWKLKSEFGPGPSTSFKQVGFVAAYSNGDLAVTDMETWKLTVVSGRHHRGSLQELNDACQSMLTKPYAIAVNADDELLVIDTSRLRVFDRDMKFLLRVNTSFPEHPDKNRFGGILSCLAVDKNNRIAVGIRGKEIISLHEQSGAFIRTIPAEMIDTQLAISRQQRLVYSNYECRKVVSTDFDGRRVFCVDTKDKKPTGVCCDNAGYIYVAMHTDTAGQCEVHHFNPDGVAIGCVINKLDNPLGLTFTQEDELVVADKYTVKIYHRI